MTVEKNDQSRDSAEAAPTDFCAPSLALAFLITAIGYAFPFLLFPHGHPLNGDMSPEILNLYFLVGWMGLAHFIYAYHGQGRALAKQPESRQKRIFAGLLALGACTLIALRQYVGWMLFSVFMWIYFIPHFVKAELLFCSVLEQRKAESHGWAVYWFPALAFTFLSFALFCPLQIAQQHWLMLVIAMGCVFLGLIGGALKALRSKATSAYVLLAFFLIAEGLVWAMYRKYMVFQFQEGVFVFHVAMTSFFHYFRSYDFAIRTKFRNNQSGMLRYLAGIIGINLGVIVVGVGSVAFLQNTVLAAIFDISFFTLWVGLHQVSSDAFAWSKRLPQPELRSSLTQSPKSSS